MRLTVDGIGKVTDTTVDLDGITVVAGPNDTGKSTIGKALFALVNSQHDFTNEFADRIAAQLTQIAVRNAAGPGLDLRILEYVKTDLKTLFADLRKRDGYGPDDVRDWFSGQRPSRSAGKDYESLCEWAAGDSPEAVEFRTKCVEYIGQDESVVRRLFATQEFQGVFDEQVNSRFSIGISTASAGLEDDRWDLESTVEFESDKCVTVESRLPERTAAILIDDPQVVNDILKPQRDYFEVLFGYRNLAHMSIDEQNRDIVDSRSSGSMSKAMTDTQAEERSRIVQDILDVLGKGCDTRTRIVNGTPVMDSTDDRTLSCTCFATSQMLWPNRARKPISILTVPSSPISMRTPLERFFLLKKLTISLVRVEYKPLTPAVSEVASAAMDATTSSEIRMEP